MGTLVSAYISQSALVLVHKVTVPRSEVADEVDVVRLAVVHGMEVIVAVDRVQGGVVGELLLGDGRVVLKAKDGSDVVLTLDGGQFTPTVRSVRRRSTNTKKSALTHHSFLTRGFSQHSVLFETALGVYGLEGAATAQEAEAKAQTVADVKRILKLMIQYEKAWESTSYSYSLCNSSTALSKRRMHHMRPSISAMRILRRSQSGPVLEGLAPVSTSLAARLAGIK